MAGKRQKPRNLLQGHRKVKGLIALPSRTREKRWTRSELEAMTRDQLRELAAREGVSKNGLKGDLVERLLANDDTLASADMPPLPVVAWPEKDGATEDWHPLTRARWSDIWASAVARTWDRRAVMPALSRYVIEMDRWYRYNELVLRVPLVKGSTGQMRENPLAARMTVIAAELRATEEKLGLTPLDAMRLGFEMGEAAAGMRKAAEILDSERYEGGGEFGVPAGWDVAQ